MAWPTIPTGVLTNGIIGQGDATYFRWGTAGVVTNTGWYLVIRGSHRYKKEDFESTNGDGIQSGRTQMIHGSVWDITVRDRTDMTPPRIGTYVTVVDMNGIVGTKVVGSTYSAYVLDSNYDASPKNPGERVVVLERLTLIEGA